jgi:hypothetical protein
VVLKTNARQVSSVPENVVGMKLMPAKLALLAITVLKEHPHIIFILVQKVHIALVEQRWSNVLKVDTEQKLMEDHWVTVNCAHLDSNVTKVNKIEELLVLKLITAALVLRYCVLQELMVPTEQVKYLQISVWHAHLVTTVLSVLQFQHLQGITPQYLVSPFCLNLCHAHQDSIVLEREMQFTKVATVLPDTIVLLEQLQALIILVQKELGVIELIYMMLVTVPLAQQVIDVTLEVVSFLTLEELLNVLLPASAQLVLNYQTMLIAQLVLGH